MRSLQNIPLSIADIQLSSPLPSPSRQSVHMNSSHQDSTSDSNTQRHPLQHTQFNFANTETNPTTPISLLAPTSSALNQITLPSLNFESPYFLDPQVYPLKNSTTPGLLKKFVFKVDGIPAYFEEIQASSTRKRPASIWDDERSFKRTEFDIVNRSSIVQPTGMNTATLHIPAISIEANSTNAYSPGPNTYPITETMLDIIPDSPNSALPSPVSDVDHNDPWSSTPLQEIPSETTVAAATISSSNMKEDVQNNKNNDDTIDIESMDVTAPEPTTKLPDTVHDVFKKRNNSSTTTPTSLQHPSDAIPFPLVHYLEQQHQIYEPSSLIALFDKLPEQIQSYLMFQLLRRSPHNTLRKANDIIEETLKRDYINDLPIDIARRILTYLDIRSLCRASAVNKKWKSIIEESSYPSNIWEMKMIESEYTPSAKERATYSYKEIVRRHTIIRRNWRENRYKKMLLEGHEEDLVTCLQFDNEKIVTGSDDHSINVYDINTGELKRVLKGHDGGVWALQYVGNMLVTGSIDRTVRVWDIERGICRFVLRGHSSTVRCLKIVMPMEIIQPDGSSTIEPEEPIIISGSRDMTIRVWRLPNLETEPIVPLSTSLDDDVISKRFLKYKLVEHENSVRDLAIYGNILVSGSYDNNVIVWNLSTGKKNHVLKGHTMKVYCVAIDRKRRHCVSGSLDATIRIWDIDSGECKFVLQGIINFIYMIQITCPGLPVLLSQHTFLIYRSCYFGRLVRIGRR
ncbi:WD40-repeat-containing domain protein [Mycotypha africana]|uniref:WD40-repeat-containing domain protein n=1 Tax=Mycotypha africana TaxID=64632 RepID=UPI002300D750|nr:WD40-repeat-containing domain protein [Mycotypha africana]KAI8967872.1 WD40-repeat-containing domain protein [Mycotypha africana]